MITTITLSLIALVLLVPSLTFSLQCFLSFLPSRKDEGSHTDATIPTTTVLIPAHNEQDCISGIIGDVSRQLNENDRMIVIADNCTDGTVELSKRLGAEVIERHNLEQRGKSYALRYALEQIEDSPTDVVIVVDSDCRISSRAISDLSTRAAKLNRPVQGSYIFGGKRGSASSNLASSFTLWFKNHIRPLGSLRLGMPCQLTGSGMAFPWDVIRKVNVANQSLAEDTTLGLELAYLGHAPIFCPEAKIDGNVPKSWGTLVQQRRRWEQGYLESIFTNAPKMVWRSIAKFQPSLLWAAFDLCIPPLALLGMAWMAVLVAAVLSAVLGGSTLPLTLLLIGGVPVGASLLLGWFFHCREKVPVQAVMALPWFLVRKVGIYFSLLRKREHVWLKTDRE